MQRTVLLISLSVALLAGLSGCKKGPVAKLNTSAAAPVLEQGWTTYDAGTFTIAGPSHYSTKPPTLLMPGMGDQPIVQNAIESVGGGKTEGTILTLYDRQARPTVGEAFTKVVISIEPGYSDLQSVIEETQDSLDEKAYEKVTLPVGEAAKFKQSKTSIGGDEMHKVVYVLAHNGNMYKFTWNCTTFPINIIDSASGPMMQTFRVKP